MRMKGWESENEGGKERRGTLAERALRPLKATAVRWVANMVEMRG